MSRHSHRSIRAPSNRILWIALIAAAVWWILEAAIHAFVLGEGPLVRQLFPENAHELWMRSLLLLCFIGFGAYASEVVHRRDQALLEHQRLQARLEDALTRVLSGFLPICAACKQIRMDDTNPDAQSSWHPLEAYLLEKTELQLTHSVCPDCERELYGGEPNLAGEERES